MSRSRLNNVQRVDNAILVGDDLNNTSLRSKFEKKSNNDFTRNSNSKIQEIDEKSEAKTKNNNDNSLYDRIFDHHKLIFTAKAYCISEISLLSERYLCGIQVNYKVDNKPTPVQTLHVGNVTPEYIETLKFKEGEDIEYLS